MIKWIQRASIFTLLILAFSLTTHAAIAKSIPLWKIEKDGVTSYIYASFPYGSKSEALPQKINDSFQAADILVLQTDPDSLEGLNINQYTVLANGKTLEQFFAKSTLAKLRAHLKLTGQEQRYGQAIRQMPWALQSTFVINALVADPNFHPDYAPDVQLKILAEVVDKKTIYLETVKDSIDRLSSGSMKFQEALLHATLDTIFDMPKMMQQSYEYWQNGDINAVYKLNTKYVDKGSHALIIDSKVEKKAVEFFATAPNQAFTDKIDTLLQKKQSLFIVLPSIHLAGNKGVISLLLKKGYRITQVSE